MAMSEKTDAQQKRKPALQGENSPSPTRDQRNELEDGQDDRQSLSDNLEWQV